MPTGNLMRGIDDASWDRKEFDWTGKSFYFVNFISLFGIHFGLNKKLEILNREIRQNGYKTKNSMVLIQYGKVKARTMLEIEKPDRYDAQVQNYDIATNADTIVHYSGLASLAKGVEKLKERVYSRRSMMPREIYYVYQSEGNANKILLIGLT